MGTSRVYVGGLSYKVTERDLDRFFRSFGRLRDIIIKNGFGFVEFDDDRDADDAVYELNGKELLGGRVTVERARATPRSGMKFQRGPPTRGTGSRHRGSKNRFGIPVRTDYRLAVENLTTRVSWQDLKDFMRQAGEVTYADAHKHKKNEGIVEFATYTDMKNALVKLDGKDLHGRRIKLVDESKKSRQSKQKRTKSSSRSSSRSRSRSHFASRSRSRSKSRSRSSSRTRSYHTKKKFSSRSKSKSDSEKSYSRSRSRSKDKYKKSFRDYRSPSGLDHN